LLSKRDEILNLGHPNFSRVTKILKTKALKMNVQNGGFVVAAKMNPPLASALGTAQRRQKPEGDNSDSRVGGKGGSGKAKCVSIETEVRLTLFQGGV